MEAKSYFFATANEFKLSEKQKIEKMAREEHERSVVLIIKGAMQGNYK